MSLKRALTSLDDRLHVKALGELLTEWRKTHHPRLARAIELLSNQLNAHQPPLSDAKKNLRQEWLTISRAHTDSTLAWLLSTIHHPRDDITEERLLTLLEWPADPRIASMAIGFLAEIGNKNARRNGPHLIALLVASKDRRHLDALEPFTHEQARLGRAVMPGLRRAIEELGRVVEKPIAESELAALEEKLAVSGEQNKRDSFEGLFDAVYAQPDDDAPRLVLADALTERDFPLGEFISLQVSRARSGEPASKTRAAIAEALGAPNG